MFDLDEFVAKSQIPEGEKLPALGDWHTTNAVAFYGEDTIKQAHRDDYKAFKNKYRHNAKAMGLALCYGGSYKVIQKYLNCSEQEAKSLHSSFFNTLSSFKKHLSKIEQDAKKTGYTRNLLGRKLYLQDLLSRDYKTQSFGLRHLFNYPIQSMGAEMIKLALIEFLKFSMDNDCNIFAGDNINKLYYNRIVSCHATREDEISTLLQDLPTGNVLLVLKNDREEWIARYHTPLAITTDFIQAHDLILEF